MKKLSINLIIWNGEKYIPYLIDSLKNQTLKDFLVMIVDNGSADKTVELLTHYFTESGTEYKIISLPENIGFANGHNLAYQNSETEYVLLLNQDMYLMPDALEKLVKFLDSHPEATAVAPRLMKWDFSQVVINKNPASGFTDKIDALGIKIFRTGRALEYLANGLVWQENSQDKKIQEIYQKDFFEVFGISGTMVIYRLQDLDKILLVEKNIFDPLYLSYQEDVDLAFRLHNVGCQSFILLNSVAYHDRGSAGPESENISAMVKNKTKQSAFVRFHSYKNHLATIYKNEAWQNMLLDWPFILCFEVGKVGYLLLTDPKILWQSWTWLWKNRKKLRQTRQTTQQARKVSWKNIRKWF